MVVGPAVAPEPGHRIVDGRHRRLADLGDLRGVRAASSTGAPRGFPMTPVASRRGAGIRTRDKAFWLQARSPVELERRKQRRAMRYLGTDRPEGAKFTLLKVQATGFSDTIAPFDDCREERVSRFAAPLGDGRRG